MYIHRYTTHVYTQIYYKCINIGILQICIYIGILQMYKHTYTTNVYTQVYYKCIYIHNKWPACLSCNFLQLIARPTEMTEEHLRVSTRCNTLQHTATHCTTLQHTATNGNDGRTCACPLPISSAHSLPHSPPHSLTPPLTHPPRVPSRRVR